MRCYLAPMEGLTDSIYRRVHHRHFKGVDRYYMPFLSPTIHRTLTHREDRELPYADSVDFVAVPQILAKVSEDFLWAAQVCRDRGYEEVNLNMGCPSGTVVSKGKGSGMLRNMEETEGFLEEIFSKSVLPVSVKTRLGLSDPEEFPKIMEVFNRYPIRELTVHPRVREDFYKGSIREEGFRWAWENSKNPLCFNGNLRNLTEVKAFEAEFPQVGSVMIGRGFIGNPGLLGGGDKKTLQAFHDELLEEYIENFGGPRNAMFRMKENWRHMICMFDCNEKLLKKLRKTTDVQEFRSIVQEIFATLPMHEELQADW